MGVERRRVKELFLDATERPASEREVFLREATHGEPELYDAVAALLAHHSDAPLLAEERAQPAPEDAAADPLGLLGARLDDRFDVERYVAEGGFAFVYRARDTTSGTPVAIKLFKEVDPVERERLERDFRREAELLDRLARDVPALVRTSGVGRCAGLGGTVLLYLVLEWLDGQTLKAEPGGAALRTVVAQLGPVARALAGVHAAGVAHRDVKPANVLVTRDGSVRLLDLGIAKVAQDRPGGFASTATARSAFTLRYAAPEQLLDRPTGPWTDVYALALTCVELLAGAHPYAGLGPLEVMLRIADPARRPTPSALGIAVPDSVERALADALSIPAEARPDVRAFWSALELAA